MEGKRSYFQRMIDAAVATELASMGGDILSTYAGRSDPQGLAMLTLGGFLLERFGKKADDLDVVELELGEMELEAARSRTRRRRRPRSSRDLEASPTVEPDGPAGTTDEAP